MTRTEATVLAEKFALEWSHNHRFTYGDYGKVKKNKRKSKKDCQRYVKKRFREEAARSAEDVRSGSIILSFLLPMIIKWVVALLIKRLIAIQVKYEQTPIIARGSFPNHLRLE